MIVAVFGTGNIGLRHLKVLDQIDGVSAIAVPKRQSRVEELSQDGRTAVMDLRNAVDLGATHCVIATDTGSHLNDGLLALDCGLEVLMEKPLSTNAKQADQLAKHAETLGRRLTVACVLRFSESLSIFRKNLNAVGRLHNVRVESQSYLPSWQPGWSYKDSFRARPTEGGVLLDLIHDIDYPGWIFGWPERVQGSLKNLGRLGIASDEVANVSWEGPQQETVSITMDFLSRPPHRRMTAYGEFGMIQWDDTGNQVHLWLDGEPDADFSCDKFRDEAFLEQTKQFLGVGRVGDNAADGRVTNAQEGTKALAICDAVRKSSESRQEELVAYP